MKNYLVTALLLIPPALMAAFNGEGRILPENYVVISDEKDNSIAKGTYVLEGTTKMFSSNSPLANVLLGSIGSGTWVRSGEEGEFTIVLQSTDQIVYFYKDGWSEVAIEDYEFKDQHRIKIDVWLWQTPKEKPNVLRKPVIYLYSDTPIDVDIKVQPKGEFTFTYPTYDHGWRVSVNQNVIQHKNKTYPYLFWEGESYAQKFHVEGNKIPGFLFETKDIVQKLESSLTQLGLNQTEKTDFITYWAPLLSTEKPYTFVQFRVNDDYNEIAEINIQPKPDHLLRVFMYCTSLETPDIGYTVVPQTFEKFERNGFTVVEWGGSIIETPKYTP